MWSVVSHANIYIGLLPVNIYIGLLPVSLQMRAELKGDARGAVVAHNPRDQPSQRRQTLVLISCMPRPDVCF